MFVLVWALWVSGGHDAPARPVAYFQTEAECVRVQGLVHPETDWSRCIKATYFFPYSKQE